MPEPKNWKRLALEGVVIVGSILLAFGLQAWWDARSDHRAQQEILRNLRQDFEQNLVFVDTASARHARIKDAAKALLQFTGPNSSTQNEQDSIAQLIEGVLYYNRLQPVQGGLTSLLNSGQWDLLQNNELQSVLAEWPTGIAALNNREDRAIEGITNRLLPRIWQLVPVRSIDIIQPEFREVGPSRFPASYDMLLRDQVFEGAVTERWWDAQNAMIMLESIRESTQHVLELIEMEIDG